MIRQLYHVRGFTVPQVVEHLRVVNARTWQCKDVSQDIVSDFLRRNPKYEIKHWQHLLQDPFVEYLQELKAGYYWVPDDILDQLPPEAWSRRYNYDNCAPVHQSFFMAKLWEEFAVSCKMRSVDLHNVWQYICKPDAPHGAVLPCCNCGYVFPHTQFIIDPRRRLNMGEVDGRYAHNCVQESAHAFVCEYCVADDGLCRDACIESLRTKWRRSFIEEQYWRQR